MPDSTITSPHPDNMDNNDDTIIDFLVKSLKSVENGIIKIDMRNEPAMQINATTNRIDIDILHPELFKIFEGEDKDKEGHDKRGRIDKLKDRLNTAKEFAQKLTDGETALFDKLNTAKEFAQKLTDNDMTIAFSRKGKEAIILGKEAKPTVSKMVSRSDDVEIKSVRELSRFSSDFKEDWDMFNYNYWRPDRVNKQASNITTNNIVPNHLLYLK